jgi:CheY-like chemotaxis protein
MDMDDRETFVTGLVLVADDDGDSRATYAEHLRRVGFAVIEASDGQAALDAACASSPDVIVLDLEMPVMDGWEAMRALRADARTRAIPVVVMSGYASTDVGAGAAGDCDVFLTKPCGPDVLTGVIESLHARGELA